MTSTCDLSQNVFGCDSFLGKNHSNYILHHCNITQTKPYHICAADKNQCFRMCPTESITISAGWNTVIHAQVTTLFTCLHGKVQFTPRLDLRMYCFADYPPATSATKPQFMTTICTILELQVRKNFFHTSTKPVDRWGMGMARYILLGPYVLT